MTKKANEEKAKLKELWILLFEEPQSLSNEQITRLLEAEKELQDVVYYVYHRFPEMMKEVQRYWARKNELSQLPIEELQEKMQKISNRRASILKSVPDEELSDSFFESSLLDSDENILYELLKE